ncbi:U11/U12 small nuclear ribonucleoprotein 35 kDa protein-like [Clavelina lepadiformis]|uniref:U11/U12 small nuclear ribonucleoprotein 35 kDa protein-like n=1 Tax=Clavelina lepadiformis TaxID=159417 RepID=UPI004042E304
MEKWRPLADEYDPLKCGSIDGTDTLEHDRGIRRAMCAKYKPNKGVKGTPHKTLFVGRLNHQTSESTLQQIFSAFGFLKKVALIRDIVTGFSKGYAFVEFKETKDARKAYKEAHELAIDGNSILVDYEHERMMKGWVPRRLGGGFGGKKESGQLRFGCRDRPFKRPIIFEKHSRSSHRHDDKSTGEGRRPHSIHKHRRFDKRERSHRHR